jgi:copper(I)-binding protein
MGYCPILCRHQLADRARGARRRPDTLRADAFSPGRTGIVTRLGRSLRFAPAVAGIALALAGCGAGQISQTAGMEPAVNGAGGNAGPIAVRDIQLAYPPDGVYTRDSNAVVLGTIVNSGQSDDELVSVTSPAGTVTVTGDKNMPAGKALILELPAGGTSATSSSVVTNSSAPSTSGSATTGPATTGPATTTTGSQTSGSQTSGAQTSGAQTSGAQTSGPATSGSQTSGSATTTTTTVTTTSSSVAPTQIGKISVVLGRLAEEVRSGKTVELTFTFRSGTVTLTVPVAVPTTPRQAAGEGH